MLVPPTLVILKQVAVMSLLFAMMTMNVLPITAALWMDAYTHLSFAMITLLVKMHPATVPPDASIPTTLLAVTKEASVILTLAMTFSVVLKLQFAAMTTTSALKTPAMTIWVVNMLISLVENQTNAIFTDVVHPPVALKHLLSVTITTSAQPIPAIVKPDASSHPLSATTALTVPPKSACLITILVAFTLPSAATITTLAHTILAAHALDVNTPP